MVLLSHYLLEILKTMIFRNKITLLERLILENFNLLNIYEFKAPTQIIFQSDLGLVFTEESIGMTSDLYSLHGYLLNQRQH